MFLNNLSNKNNKNTSKILSPAKLCRGTPPKKEILPKTDKFHICPCGKLSTPLLLPTNVGAKPWEVDKKSKKWVTLLGGSSPWKSLSPFKTWQGSFLMMILQEIFNRTHVSRTPKKPEYLIALICLATY